MLLAHTPAGQLLKLPVLVEHYIKHQQREGVSFAKFLATHYATNHRDADFPEDEQLPFRYAISYSLDYAIVPPVVQTHMAVRVLPGKKIIFTTVHIPELFLASIFRPPRVSASIYI